MMTTTLFETSYETSAPLTKIQAILSDPQQLPRWNPEVQRVTPVADAHFLLTRKSTALNPTEQLTLTTVDHRVTYQGRGPKFSYRLDFDLSTEAGQTVITETLTLLEINLPVPVKLVAPLIKRVFTSNMQHLLTLVATEAV